MEKSLCNCDNCDLKVLFYNSMNAEEILLMCDKKTEKHYEKGSTIFQEGDEIKDFLYLKTGLVKLHRNGPNGKAQIISFAKPLDFVSLLSVFSDSSYNYSVTAIENSTFCCFNLDEIKQFIRENGNFAMSIIEKLSKSSDKIILESLEIRQKHLRGRIAYILLYFAEKIYNNYTFDLPVSRREIGELISMTTENVIRIFSEFRKDKILKISGHTIEINDINKLHQIERLG